MGTVYRARHRDSGQVVAIKVMAGTSSNRLLFRRFEQEFAAASRIRHPHVVRGIDFGVANGRPYLVMEFVEGQNLDQRVRQRGPLPQGDAVRVIRQVAGALAAAHRAEVIHRDVKPENILLTADGQAKLTDLGLSKDLRAGEGLTATMTCLGTIAFIAPEQFEDAKRADARADVYGLGATLYHALTGVAPFVGRAHLVILAKKLHNDFAPPRTLVPSLDASVDRAICRALDADPSRRQSSCDEFSSDLGDAPPAAAAEVGGEPLSFPEDRRRAPRYPSALGARCRSLQDGKNRWPADIQDLSLTGVCLETSRRFEAGTVLVVEVLVEPGKSPVLLLAEVRWVRARVPGRWGLGCAFDRPLTAPELEALLGNKPSTVVITPAGRGD
jgi:serine/threonine protein kinase